MADKERHAKELADAYFKTIPFGNWDVIHYLERNQGVAKQKLLHSWVLGLQLIDESKGYSKDEKVQANRLYDAYPSRDKVRAREWSKPLSDHDPGSNNGCNISVLIDNSVKANGKCVITNGNNAVVDELKSSTKCSVKEGVSPGKKGVKRGRQNSIKSRPPLYAAFCQAYHRFVDEKKWKLPKSGKYVEDILYQMAKESTHESIAHSWTIDLDDPEVARWFAEDWEYICQQMSAWPEDNLLLIDYFTTFKDVAIQVINTGDYWRLLRNDPVPQWELDAGYDQAAVEEKYSAPIWGKKVMDDVYELFKRGDILQSRYNLESWFNANVWHGLLDKSVMSVNDVHLSRGEGGSESHIERKRAKASKGQRRPTGNRYDGVLRYSDIEIGAVEHAKEYKGEDSRKWLSDALKLVKVLHDMLGSLQDLVQSDERLRNVEVLGLLTAGLHCQHMRLKYAHGYICLVKRQRIRKFPSTFFAFPDLFGMALEFWGMRTILQKNIRVIREAKAASYQDQFTSRDFNKTFLRWLPSSIDTDNEGGNGMVEEF